MSEKKWTCKWKSCGRRGRHHKGKEFPRHGLQYYEGTHLSMRKRTYSKSKISSVWRGGRAALTRKYIIGLLNKYVGKTYEEFKFVFDQKTKTLYKKYNITWNNLKDYLHDKEKESVWYEEFFIDNEGFIRKCKQVRKRLWRSVIKKKHINYNKRVEIPYWGQVRTAMDMNYSETMGKLMFPKFREPLLLGKFYVAVKGKVFKLPVYTCNQDIFINYYNHRESEWDYTKKTYVITPFWECNSWYVKHNQKKAYRIAHEWIKVEVQGIPRSQNYFVRMKNLVITEYEKYITNLTINLKETTDPLDKCRIEEQIADYKERIERIPKEAVYNMGYGRYYTFVKVTDYEKETF